MKKKSRNYLLFLLINCLFTNIYAEKSVNKKSTSEKDSIVLFSYLNSYNKGISKKDTTYQNRLLDIAIYYKEKNKIELSNKYLLKMFEVKSDLPKTIQIFQNISVNYQIENNTPAAINILQKILQLSKDKSRFCKDYLMAVVQYSNILYRQGDYQKSIEICKLGESQYHKNTKKEYLAHVYREWAKSLNRMGQHLLALSKIDQSLSYLDQSSSYLDLAQVNQVKGYIYIAKGDFTNGLKYFELVSKLFKENNNFYEYFNVAIDIGYNYYLKNEYEKALSAYQNALFLKPNGFAEFQLLDNIGAVYWKKKQFELGLKYYQKSLSTNYFINYSDSNYLNLPKANLFKYSDFKRAFLNVVLDKAICWLDYYKDTKNESHLLNALETYLLADKLIDYMRHEHKGIQSKYFWRNKTRPVYEAAIETCFLLKDYKKAFYFFEKSRSVLLNDKLNEMGASQKLSMVDQQKENDLQRKIMELNTEIEGEKNEKKKENLNAKLIDFQDAQSQFVKSLEEKNPAYYEMKYDTNVATLTHAQQYLKSNFNGKPATIVEYFVGDSATYAIVISANKVDIKKINFNQKIANHFLELSSKSIQTKTDLNSFLATSSNLYSLIIKPLNIEKGHLIISQDGTFLPFEALSISEKNPQYLINDYAISYTYSAQVLLKNKSENSFAPHRNFIGFAPINFQKLASLMGSKKSISNIGSHYILSTNLIEKEANKKAFLKQASNFQIVQLYTHALADSNETEPRIYFADSSLKVSELSAENRFKTNLLVLSACKTGVGKLAKGEGVLSLARGFSMLGIPSTITSLWSVEDIDTYTVTELFYKYLNNGFAKDEALQKAKIEFININQNSMPNQWAGLVLVGETSPMNANKYFQYLIGLLALMVIAVLIYRKRKTLKLPFQS